LLFHIREFSAFCEFHFLSGEIYIEHLSFHISLVNLQDIKSWIYIFFRIIFASLWYSQVSTYIDCIFASSNPAL